MPRVVATLENIYQLAEGTDDEQRKAIRWEDCPGELVAKLFQSNEYGVREIAAKHPNMPAEFIRSLFNSTFTVNAPAFPEALRSPKWNQLLESQFGRHFSSEASWANRVSSEMMSHYRRDISVNPNVPADVLESFLLGPGSDNMRAGDYINLSLRDMFLKHPNLPVELSVKLLDRHSSDLAFDVDFRQHLAENPNLSEDVVKRLVSDSAWEVHRSLALNKGVDPKLLWPLLVSRQVKVLNPLSKRYSGDEQELVLTRLGSVSKSATAKAAIASRTSDPDKIMSALLGDDYRLKDAVLRNPNITEEAKVAYQLISG